jgi:hypothetical protein
MHIHTLRWYRNGKELEKAGHAGLFLDFKKPTRKSGENLTNSEPGVDVMIAIFCVFCQFSVKISAFFLKNQCYDHNKQLFEQITPIFGEFVLQNLNIGPDQSRQTF